MIKNAALNLWPLNNNNVLIKLNNNKVLIKLNNNKVLIKLNNKLNNNNVPIKLNNKLNNNEALFIELKKKLLAFNLNDMWHIIKVNWKVNLQLPSILL